MKKSIINITSIALKKLKMIITENNMKAIRFSLKTGGCNGFEYNLEPVNDYKKRIGF